MDKGTDFGQSFDLQTTVALVGPYHVVSKFMVSLDHLQGDHKVDIRISVPQLVEFNVD